MTFFSFLLASIMAVRSALSRVPGVSSSVSIMENFSAQRGLRYFTIGIGKEKVLGEEERAAENVYIQRMERERMEKSRLNAEKEKAVASKVKSSNKGKSVEEAETHTAC